MGLFVTKLMDVFSSFMVDDMASILMVGLDGAGKTTILYQVKLTENVSTIPTIGFNVETVTPCKGISFTVWDIGGQAKIRPLWKSYCQNARGIIYVVDSSDRERLHEPRDELFGVLNNDDMKGVPVIVLANKQDLPASMSVSDIAAELQLAKLRDHKWHVQGTCAIAGDGICEGMQELAHMVKDFKRAMP